MNLNRVILIGRLTKDPEKKVLNSGTEVVRFGLATDRYFLDKSGQKRQETEFHNVVLFGKIGNIASLYLKKGSLVLVEGRIQTRTWQDNDGNKVSRVEIIGERIQLGPRSYQNNQTGEKKEEEIPIIEENEQTPEIKIDDIPF